MLMKLLVSTQIDNMFTTAFILSAVIYLVKFCNRKVSQDTRSQHAAGNVAYNIKLCQLIAFHSIGTTVTCTEVEDNINCVDDR